MKIFITSILVGLSLISSAQEIVTELNGFRLGQFREVPKNELKTILRDGAFEDGFEYEMYLVEEDTSAYMIFEYANYDLKTIWSMQLTGRKKGFDCGFKGLKLGMSIKEIKSIMGDPSSIEDAGKYGEKWVYENSNYSLEVNPKGKLAGVKIIDMSHDFFPEPDLEKIPTPEQYSEVLNSKDRKVIADLLAPGMEIYKNDSVYFFNNSFKDEVDSDASGLFELLEEMKEIINQTDFSDSLQYEENMRFSMGQETVHVAKFMRDGKYSEMVFKYMFGKYLIWEIKLD